MNQSGNPLLSIIFKLFCSAAFGLPDRNNLKVALQPASGEGGLAFKCAGILI
jgi:hypothetical protein